MKKLFNLKTVLMLLALVFLLASCQKDKDLNQKKISNSQIQGAPIVKEFELKESWFPKSNLKSTIINGDIYNNFGIGYDELTGSQMLSIFNPNVSLSPIVSTAINEKTDLKYVSTSSYSQIDSYVTSSLAASLNVSTTWVEANANISVSNSSRIINTSNSVYVSVLYIKRYGTGTLQFTAPTVNDYLTYRTNLNDYTQGGKDGITITPTNFRGIYGDKFKHLITFGVLMVGYVQITGVDFTSTTKSDASASASAAVADMVSAKVSWSSEQSKYSCFKNSSIVVSVEAIPRTSTFVTDIPGLINQLSYMDQCYASNDLGIISNSSTNYSNLYPTYNFINVDGIFYGQQSQQIPLYNNVYDSYTYLGNSNKNIGNWLPINFNPLILKPIYVHSCLASFQFNFLSASSTPLTAFKDNVTVVGYVFTNKIYDNLVPLYFAKDLRYTYPFYVYNTTGIYPSGYTTPTIMGYIFPNQ